MKHLIIAVVLQTILLSFLIIKDKNDGEKEMFREQPWKVSQVVIVMLLINIYMCVIYFLSKIYSVSISGVNGLVFFYLFLSLILIILVFKAKRGFRILGFKKFEFKKNIRVIIVSSFILLLLYIIGSSGNTLNMARYMKNLGLLEEAVYVMIIVIIAPIVEESLFRGIMYSPYRKKYGAKVAIFLNAILFSLIHYAFKGRINGTYFIGGIVSCLLYEKTESIIPSVVAHSGNNLLSIMTGFYMLK